MVGVTEVITIIGAMIAAFFMGAIGMAFLGSKTTLNYFLAKASRGKKAIMFIKTPFGWITEVATKDGDVLKWKHLKIPYTTSLKTGEVMQRYGTVDCAYVDIEKSTETIKFAEGKMFPADFDPKVYNNLLIRAITRPNFDGQKDLEKKVLIVLVFALITMIFSLLIYLNTKDILTVVKVMNAARVI